MYGPVEMMYSLEEMYRITGDNRYADLLERVAYNALPTQISPEGDARQYFQQVNQTAVTLDVRNFSTTHEDTDLVFGRSDRLSVLYVQSASGVAQADAEPLVCQCRRRSGGLWSTPPVRWRRRCGRAVGCRSRSRRTIHSRRLCG